MAEITEPGYPDDDPDRRPSNRMRWPKEGQSGGWHGLEVHLPSANQLPDPEAAAHNRASWEKSKEEAAKDPDNLVPDESKIFGVKPKPHLNDSQFDGIVHIDGDGNSRWITSSEFLGMMYELGEAITPGNRVNPHEDPDNPSTPEGPRNQENIIAGPGIPLPPHLQPKNKKNKPFNPSQAKKPPRNIPPV